MFSSTAKILCNTVRAGKVFQDVPLFGQRKMAEPAAMVVRAKSACDEPPPKKCYTGRPKKRPVPDQDPKYDHCEKKECDDYVPMDLQERKEYPPCRQKTWDDCPKPPKKVIRTCLTEKEKPKKVKCPVGMCCNEKDGKIKYSTYAPMRRFFTTYSRKLSPVSGRRFIHEKSSIEQMMDPNGIDISKYPRVKMPGCGGKSKKAKILERQTEKAFRVMAPIPSFSECARSNLPQKLSADVICSTPTTLCLYRSKRSQ